LIAAKTEEIKMDSIDAANKLSKEFGVDQTDAMKAIDAEVDDLRADPFRGRKPSYQDALNQAYETIREWLKTDLIAFQQGGQAEKYYAYLQSKATEQESSIRDFAVPLLRDRAAAWDVLMGIEATT
jgi:hypothetical protein